MNPSHRERVLSACQRLNDKLNIAAIQLESERRRTIININNDEHTVLVWALHEFWDRIENMGGEKATQQQGTDK